VLMAMFQNLATHAAAPYEAARTSGLETEPLQETADPLEERPLLATQVHWQQLQLQRSQTLEAHR
jgi:hypothetical protein